ncbi:hypothetical protein BOTBODRAFT_127006 [Botryobasidium botryosum FD-172 SS1]|uniref:FAD-binding PCMH-type domain-containing protein n=1 Tax=Botryobasidium botryosum (strain FD-172 SS1) TaxID=930990 RepID=A0A067MU18_BOTB1|nr:hypothetical protein BOTBODRAFT_127006 [Botryobasidium botryosum FD-172 SS1]
MASILSDFKYHFKGAVTQEGDPEYSIKRWARNAERKAKFVVFPTDAQDVSRAILFARSQNLEIAIRGGGHSTSGASSTEGGLVIDMSKHMNKVRIDPEYKRAYVQGGAIFETLDRESIKHGLAGTAGTVNHTGFGGLTTGGGYGWLSGLHGLAVDNLVAATVVTANGDILKASDSENPDLFWGIRGGGVNFGPVTEFVFKLYDQRPDVFISTLVYPESLLPKVLDSVNDWLKVRHPRESAFLVYGLGPNAEPCVIFLFVFNGPEDEGREAIKNLVALGPIVNDGASVPYVEMNAMQNPRAYHGTNRLLKGILVPNLEPALMTRAWHGWKKIIAENPSASETIMMLELYHPDKILSVPIDAMAFVARVTSYSLMVSLTWSDDSLDARALSHELFRAIDVKGVGSYGNYDDVGAAIGGDRTRAMFGSNYDKLRIIKKKYDPEMVFHKWFPITPAP